MLFEQNRAQSLDQTLAEFRQAFDKLIAAVERLTGGELNTTGRVSWDFSRSTALESHCRSLLRTLPRAYRGHSSWLAACLPLFYERGIAVIGTDTTNDVIPSGYPSLTNPIHQVGLVAMGFWILDRANLEDPSQKCRELNR